MREIGTDETKIAIRGVESLVGKKIKLKTHRGSKVRLFFPFLRFLLFVISRVSYRQSELANELLFSREGKSAPLFFFFFFFLFASSLLLHSAKYPPRSFRFFSLSIGRRRSNSPRSPPIITGEKRNIATVDFERKGEERRAKKKTVRGEKNTRYNFRRRNKWV